MRHPLITIGMTCYNAEDTISRAVESALSQDWPNIEIIVVDDCSSDGSVEILQRYTKEHSSITLICNDANKGFPGALNVILAHARGEFIAIFDDDDVSLPHRLKQQVICLQEFSRTHGDDVPVACFGTRVKIYDNGYRAIMPAIGSKPKTPSGKVFIDYALFFERANGYYFASGTPSCALMMHRSSFELVGLYDERLRKGEDLDLAIRLALKGGVFIGCSSIVIEQYATEGSDKAPLAWFESHSAILEKYRHYLEENKRYHYSKNWHKLRYLYFSGQFTRATICLLKLLLRHPLWTAKHFVYSAPRRLLHGARISRRAR